MESIMRVRGANSGAEDGPPSNADDRRAITRCLSGDLDAFTAIVERHQDRLMWTAYHLLGDHEAAADAVQDTFLRAYRALDTFGGDGYVGAWLGRIVVNVCLSMLRARTSRPVADHGRWDWGATDARYARTEQSMILGAALAQLDVQDRAILLLRHISGLSSSDIGQALGLPPATVRSRMARALTSLRTLLPDQMDLCEGDSGSLTFVPLDGETER